MPKGESRERREIARRLLAVLECAAVQQNLERWEWQNEHFLGTVASNVFRRLFPGPPGPQAGRGGGCNQNLEESLVIPTRKGNHCPIPYRVRWSQSAPGLVALVRLAEAHVPVPVALHHARVVHHEEVHLEVVGARTPHLVVLWN